jgi:hypothetical protein
MCKTYVWPWMDGWMDGRVEEEEGEESGLDISPDRRSESGPEPALESTFESTEHVSCTQPFTYSVHSIQEPSLPAMSILRPPTSCRVNTGCSRDSSRENIVGHDQGAHDFVASKHSYLKSCFWYRRMAPCPLQPTCNIASPTQQRVII